MTKVTVTPWEVNCKCSLVPSEKHIFVFEFSRFSNFLKIFQLLSHVCRNMAIQTANVHWSPAGSILFFTSQGGWTTFVTRLQEYGHPDCKCLLVSNGKHTCFYRKFTPECWRRLRIMFSRDSSFGTLKSIRRVSKIVHFPNSSSFFSVISNTLSVSTLKTIRRRPQIGHLKSRRSPIIMPMQVWSIRSLLKS